MPIDRDAALEEAEHLFRQGKLGAIEAYLRPVEDRPSDRNSIDARAELCLRAGDVERAIARFTRAAQEVGDTRKAAALFRAVADDFEQEGRLSGRTGEVPPEIEVPLDGDLSDALVPINLDLDSGGYRDGRVRLDRLVSAQAGSHGQ